MDNTGLPPTEADNLEPVFNSPDAQDMYYKMKRRVSSLKARSDAYDIGADLDGFLDRAEEEMNDDDFLTFIGVVANIRNELVGKSNPATESETAHKEGGGKKVENPKVKKRNPSQRLNINEKELNSLPPETRMVVVLFEKVSSLPNEEKIEVLKKWIDGAKTLSDLGLTLGERFEELVDLGLEPDDIINADPSVFGNTLKKIVNGDYGA